MIIFTVSEPGSRANRWGSLCIVEHIKKKRQHKIIKKKVCLICWRLSYFGYPCKTPLRQTSYTGQINQQEFPWNSSFCLNISIHGLFALLFRSSVSHHSDGPSEKNKQTNKKADVMPGNAGNDLRLRCLGREGEFLADLVFNTNCPWTQATR